jgi:hypothetical protein
MYGVRASVLPSRTAALEHTPYIGKRINTPFGSKRQSLYELPFAHPLLGGASRDYPR